MSLKLTTTRESFFVFLILALCHHTGLGVCTKRLLLKESQQAECSSQRILNVCCVFLLVYQWPYFQAVGLDEHQSGSPTHLLLAGSDLPQVSQGTRIDEHCYLVIECFLLLVRDDVNILFAVNLRSTWVSRHQTAALLALSYSVSYDQRFTSPKSNTRNRVHIVNLSL